MAGLPNPNLPLPVVGEVRVRISYALRVVGFLGHDAEVAILEGVEDGRRTTVAVREVQTWKVV